MENKEIKDLFYNLKNNIYKFINKLEEPENNKVETLLIDKNIIKVDDYNLIQMRNVSYLSVKPKPPRLPYKLSIVIVMITFLLLKLCLDIYDYEDYLMSFMTIIMSAIFYLIIAFAYNKTRISYLNFHLDSGFNYKILIKDDKFLRDVFNKIEDYMNGLINGIINVDIKNGSINVTHTENNIDNSTNTINNNTNIKDNRKNTTFIKGDKNNVEQNQGGKKDE